MSMIPSSGYEYHEVFLAAGYHLVESENTWAKKPFIGYFYIERRWYEKPKPGTWPIVQVWWPVMLGRWAESDWKVKRARSLARAHSLRELKEAGVGKEAFEVAKVLEVCS
jgi:hypothetical protein